MATEYKTLDAISQRIGELDAIIKSDTATYCQLTSARLEREHLLWDFYNLSPKHN